MTVSSCPNFRNVKCLTFIIENNRMKMISKRYSVWLSNLQRIPSGMTSMRHYEISQHHQSSSKAHSEVLRNLEA